MRPLILAFTEPALDENVDTHQIEYDKELQLSVMKGTKIPAFDCLQHSTKTFTKANAETTDEVGNILSSLHTNTYSANDTETTDSDNTLSELKSLLSTKTMTFTNTEASDDDNALKPHYLMATMTGTRTYREETDSDN